MKRWVNTVPDMIQTSGLRIRLTDATCVEGPGKKTSLWRIHYAVELPSLLCDEIKVTDCEVGESFKNFTVRPGDLLLGDRGYAHARGIASVIERGGHVLVNEPEIAGFAKRRRNGFSDSPILEEFERWRGRREV